MNEAIMVVATGLPTPRTLEELFAAMAWLCVGGVLVIAGLAWLARRAR